MEKISTLELVAVGVPVTIYWFYTLFLMLTDASPHKGIQISKRRKIIVTSIVLVPLALLWGLRVFNAKAVDVEVALGTFFTPLAEFVVVIWMLCAPIALLYSIVLILKNAYVLFPTNPPQNYRVNSTEDCIQTMNAAVGFAMHRRKFEEEQEELDREYEEVKRNAQEEDERERFDRFGNPELYI